MLTIGTVIVWHKKSEHPSLCRKGYVSQWRSNPDKVELLPEKGLAYGEWVNMSDITIVDQGARE